MKDGREAYGKGVLKTSPISTDEYLLACCRYVELNPVRLGIVADPADYRWSSYGVKIANRKEELLHYDPCYLGLADSEKKTGRKLCGMGKRNHCGGRMGVDP